MATVSGLAFGLFSSLGFLITMVSAATIHGTTVQWFTLDPLEETIVTVNTTPQQVFVSQDGNYSFDVPPGDYLIIAEFYQNNILLYRGEEEISVRKREGDFVIDLVLFPFVEDPEMGDTIDFPLENESRQLPEDQTANIIVIPLLLVLTVAVATIGWYVLKLRNRPPTKEVKIINKVERVVETKPLPTDLNELFEFIQQQKRLTQKELRERFRQYSEAKISLMVSDLEDRGLIRKIKKGRGNIIVVE